MEKAPKKENELPRYNIPMVVYLNQELKELLDKLIDKMEFGSGSDFFRKQLIRIGKEKGFLK